MGRVKVGEHVWMKLSRRSLCDNCSAELCVYNHGERMDRCDRFTPALVAFKKCEACSAVFEVNTNFRALNYDLCPRCNAERDQLLVHS